MVASRRDQVLRNVGRLLDVDHDAQLIHNHL